MRLITNVFNSRELSFSMTIQPKQEKDIEGNFTQSESMFKPYQSKVGPVSLVFNPHLYMTIQPKFWEGNVKPVVTIPAHMIYRFANMVTSVYNRALEKGLYKEDNGLFLDMGVAAAAARRMSLFKCSLTVFPDIISSRNGDQQRAISFQMDKLKMGSITLPDAMSLIDVIDHLDINTYQLIVGVMEGINDVSDSNQMILDKLSRIEALLQSGVGSVQIKEEPKPRNSSAAGIFDWQPAGGMYGI